MNAVKNETRHYLTEDELIDLWKITREVDIPKDELKKISAILSEYVSLFINDGLSQLDRNFLKFTQQRKLTFAILKDSIEKYGNELVLYGLTLDNYLFVHSLLALEQQGYLDIKELNKSNVRTIANQKLLKEIGSSEKNSATISTNKLSFNGNELVIGDKEIDLSNSRRGFTKAIIKVIFEHKNKGEEIPFSDLLKKVSGIDFILLESYARKAYYKKIKNSLGYIIKQIKIVTNSRENAFIIKGNAVRINNKLL